MNLISNTIRKVLTIAILLSVLLLFNSCIFSLTDFYENPVNKNPTPPGITTVKLDLEDDTVYTYSSRSIYFQFESDNQAIQGAKLLIDDLVIDSVSSDSGKMMFQSWDVADGIHKLTLQIYTASGTGSIADKLGGESFVMSRNWVLLMDDTRSDNTKCQAENGFLKVSWETYKAKDFTSYVVVHEDNTIAEISSSGQTQMIDSSYVGEGGSYTVYIKRNDGMLLGWGSYPMPSALPVLRFGATPDNGYYMWWNKSTYHNAIQKLQFVLNSTTKEESINLEDTTYQLSLPFNQSFSFSLNVIPKYPSTTYSSNLSAYGRSISDKTGIKLQIPESTSLRHISQDVVAYKNGNAISFYQLSTNMPLKTQTIFKDKLIWDLALSPTFKYAMGFYFTGSSKRNYVLENLETEQVTSVPDYSSMTGGISQSINLSDIGTGVFLNNLGNEIVFDYRTGGKLAINNTRWSSSSFKISADGKYYVVDAIDSLYVYALVNGQSGVNRVAVYDKSNVKIDRWEFDPVNPNLFYILYNHKLIGLQCDQSKTITEFSIAESVLSIDFYNKEILCSAANKFRIRSLTDGSLLRDIPLSFTPNIYDSYKLCNHLIIANGFLAYRVN